MITYGPDTFPDYSVGTMATYMCEDGYNLVGNMVRVCQSDGTFSGTDPVCGMDRKHSHVTDPGKAKAAIKNCFLK